VEMQPGDEVSNAGTVGGRKILPATAAVHHTPVLLIMLAGHPPTRRGC
jgi:hypothetical protein